MVLDAKRAKIFYLTENIFWSQSNLDKINIKFNSAKKFDIWT